MSFWCRSWTHHQIDKETWVGLARICSLLKVQREKTQIKPLLSWGMQSDTDDRKTRETVLSGKEKMSWK